VSDCIVKSEVDKAAIEIGDLYRKGCSSLVDSAKYYIEAGRLLIEVKKTKPHGQWLPWLAKNAEVLGFGARRTATKLMQGTKWAVNGPFDEAQAVKISRKLWGNALEEERAKLVAPLPEDGCTVEDLNELITAGKKFKVIYADPPWEFKVYSGKGKQRSADRHYNTQSLDDIKALPIANLAADDCALFLWCVWPELPGALEVIKAWGFEYKTLGFNWVKQTKNSDSLHWGMGYWTRANTEGCLLATRGAPKRQAMDVHQVIMSPVGEHSRKPEGTSARIERLLPGPYLELFARRPMAGWTVWGNEITRGLFHQSIPEFAA
jgi:N6-adenosine-specific RNA methylase IME4